MAMGDMEMLKEDYMAKRQRHESVDHDTVYHDDGTDQKGGIRLLLVGRTRFSKTRKNG